MIAAPPARCTADGDAVLLRLDGGQHHAELLEAAEEAGEPALEAVLRAAAAVGQLLDELRERPACEREPGVVAAARRRDAGGARSTVKAVPARPPA